MSNLIPGFTISQTIYESSRTAIFRATRTSDALPVVLKLNNQNYPSLSELSKYENEYRILKTLDHVGIIKAFGLENYQNKFTIVFEDFQGTSISEILKRYTFSMEDFLNIAISITDIIGVLHSQGIIHKDINPSNILWNADSFQIKLIDFGISTTAPEIKKNSLDGSPPYVSPEQTGRVSGRLDYRTDFYSLGVTFYQMLTGKLPFEANDIMELIHSHIAKSAPAPKDVNNTIPEVISDIIMKLMSKAADDRYKSAAGLKTDLEMCLSHLNADGTIPYFQIGKKDITTIFRIPEKLYGRENEILNLEKTFDKVKEGTKQLTLVTGRSGSGKTSLVNAIHKTVVSKNGYMIRGCFDQFKKSNALSCFCSGH